ncbi:hypothetical protein ACGFXC_24925 [Streptomyces sp. NPDC048507]|uniref:hypothetical protein n=1 Tax=Streptomyces sp. NPDC048507 TaxID=3365560 RepID=UPI0037219C7E
MPRTVKVRRVESGPGPQDVVAAAQQRHHLLPQFHGARGRDQSLARAHQQRVTDGTTEVLAEPHELCFDPTERLLWCTTAYRSGYHHANGGLRTELTVIDPEHGPHGLALDAARGRLYVSVEGSADRPGGVVVIDTRTRRPLGRIDTDAPGPHRFAIGAAGRTGYASNKEAPFVSEGLAVSPDGSRACVAAPRFSAHGERPAPGIRVVDLETLRPPGRLDVGRRGEPGAHGLAYVPRPA